MKNYIIAKLKNDTVIFKSILNFIPHKGEELDVNGEIFLVENVRYILKDGYTSYNHIILTLKQV